MQAITQKWVVPKSRHLSIDLPATVPEGPVDVVVVFEDARARHREKPGIAALIGSLRGAPAFSEDSVQLQRALRDEW
jgi:hypothetical protein